MHYHITFVVRAVTVIPIVTRVGHSSANAAIVALTRLFCGAQASQDLRSSPTSISLILRTSAARNIPHAEKGVALYARTRIGLRNSQVCEYTKVAIVDRLTTPHPLPNNRLDIWVWYRLCGSKHHSSDDQPSCPPLVTLQCVCSLNTVHSTPRMDA